MRCLCSPLLLKSKTAGRLVLQTARLMVGVPDYDAYVEHLRRVHPGEPVMTQAEFFRERQDRRYGVGPGSAMRCC